MIMDTERRVWERRQGGRLHSHVAFWMVRSSGPGYLLSGGGMEEVPCHDPRVGRASGTPDCFTLVWTAPGGKRPFSATGENTDSFLL